MKMTNLDMINNHNRLDAFQVREKEYSEHAGKKLLAGRVKIGYAIEKNKEIFRRELKPYDKTLASLVEEYRDTEAENAAIKAEQEVAEREGRPAKDVSVIIRDGKDREEYFEKVKELQEIEVEVDDIRTVNMEDFDGLDLDSSDLRPFMFMMAE